MSDKFCVDCKWAKKDSERRWFYCQNPDVVGRDLVTGAVRESACEYQRSDEWFIDWRRCKPQGRFWEPKQ